MADRWNWRWWSPEVRRLRWPCPARSRVTSARASTAGRGRLPADGPVRPRGRVIRLEGPDALLDLLSQLVQAPGGLLDLGGMCSILVHGDDRTGQVRPGHLQVRRQLAARAAGGAFDVLAGQDDDVEVAHRAQPRRC